MQSIGQSHTITALGTGFQDALTADTREYISTRTKQYLSKGRYDLPSIKERKETALLHYDLMVKYYGEKVASHGMRKHAMGYVKGLKKSAECKSALSRAESRKDYEEAFALIG